MKGNRAMKKRAPTQAKLRFEKRLHILWEVVSTAGAVFLTESSSSLLSSAALAAAMRAEARVGVASAFGALTTEAGLAGVSLGIAGVAGLAAFRAGLRPRLLLLEGVGSFFCLTSFLTSLALSVNAVPSSKVTSYSLSSSRTKETLALKNKLVPGHLIYI